MAIIGSALLAAVIACLWLCTGSSPPDWQPFPSVQSTFPGEIQKPSPGQDLPPEDILNSMTVDGEGQPVGGVVLRFFREGENTPVHETASDAEGLFTLYASPREILRVEAVLDGFLLTINDWVFAREEVVRVILQQTSEMHIHVQQKNGRPAPRARVRFIGSAVYPAMEVMTDDEGSWHGPEIPTGFLAFEALFENQVAELAGVELLAGRTTRVHLVLADGITLNGLVRDEKDGKPVEGALFTISREEPSILTRPVRTDDAGRFRIGPLPVGNHRFSLSAHGFVALVGRRFWVGPTSGLALFELSRGVTLSGRVVDETGHPVSGAAVECWGIDASGQLISPLSLDTPGLLPVGELGVTDRRMHIGQAASGATMTGEDGTFTLTGIPPGHLFLQVSADRFIPHGRSLGEVTDDEDVRDIRMKPGRETTLFVVDDRQIPAPGVEIRVESPQVPGLGYTTFTDSGGEARLHSVPGEFTVSFFHPRFPVHVVTLGNSSFHKVVLPRGTQEFSLRLKDAAGMDVEGALVELLSTRRPEQRARLTDRHGVVEIGQLGPGPWRVVVSHPDYARMEHHDVSAGSHEWIMPYGGGFTAFVRDRQTLDGLSATVRLVHSGGQEISRETRKGEVEFRSLPEGSWKVLVEAHDYVPMMASIQVPGGATIQDFSLVPQLWELSRAGGIAGTVRDDRGFVVRGAVVSVEGRVTRTDRNGTFAFASLPEGRLAVMAWHHRYGLGTETVHVLMDQTSRDVMVDLSPARERGETSNAGLVLDHDRLRSLLVVQRVVPDSAAAQAGLRKGDIVWRVNGLAPYLPLFVLTNQLSGPVGSIIYLEVGEAEWLARPVFIRLK